MRNRFCLAIPLLGIALSSPAVRGQDAVLTQETNFLRNLATDLGFTSLARSEIERRKQGTRDSDDLNVLRQLEIEISLIGARRDPDRERRRTLYAEAIEASQKLIGQLPDRAKISAQVTLTEASIEFGRFLAEEIEIARTEDPEKVSELEEEAAKLYRTGVEAAEAAMAGLKPIKDQSQQNNLDYYLSWLRKGILLREHAAAVKADRGYLADRSRDTLEEMVFDVGEESALGMRAMFEYAQNDEVTGDYESAQLTYQDTIATIWTALVGNESAGQPPVGGDVAELIFVMMEETYLSLTRVLLREGKVDEVLKVVDEYRSRLDHFKAEPDPRFGDQVFLIEAQALSETGDPELVAKALTQAKRINDDHPNDIVGLRAKQLIKALLEASTSVSGADLFEVAKGEYQSKNYETALRGFKRAIAAMTREESDNVGLEAYYLMGRSYALQNRFLEATIAFTEGLQRFGKKDEDELTKNVAESLDTAAKNLSVVSKRDPYFDTLREQVSSVVTDYLGEASQADVFYRQGANLISEGKWQEAAAAYARLTPEAPRYDLAVARRVLCWQNAGDFAKARALADEFQNYARSEKGQIPEDRRDLAGYRVHALAEIDYFLGYMTFLEATGHPLAGGKEDPTKLPKVIDALSDYVDTHGKNLENYVQSVYAILARAHALLGDLPKAEEKLRALRNLDANSNQLPGVYTAIVAAHQDNVRALEKEVAAIASNGDEDRTKAAEKRLADAGQKLLEACLDYMNATTKPQYEILYIGLREAEDLRDWDQVRAIGDKILEIYEGDETYADRVIQFAMPVIGNGFLKQRNFRKAYDLLSAAETKRPNNYPLKRLVALAMGGWIELDDRGNTAEFTGIGEHAKGFDKMYGEYRNLIRAQEENYSLEWYRFHWEAYAMAYFAAQTDPEYQRRARNVYKIAQSTDDFETLRKIGTREARDLYDLFMAYKGRP